MRPCFFLNCALFVFRQTCEENRPILTTSLKSVALCYQVCSLFCIVARFFQENALKLSKINDGGNSSEASHEVESSSLANADNAVFPPNLLAEWQEFFSGPLFNTVLRLFMFHAGERRVAVKVWSFPEEARGGMTALMMSLFLARSEGEGEGEGELAHVATGAMLYVRTLLMCLS